MAMEGKTVRFNVGGKIFETTETTLANAGRNSILGALFDENWNLKSKEHKEVFIDRNPACFSVLLDLLRTGELHVPNSISERLLYKEAMYYGLIDHVRSAKWGKFDGDRLNPVGSITYHSSPGKVGTTAIRAGSDGGCSIVLDRFVRVYDWTFEELSKIVFCDHSINDVAYIDSENIVVSACKEGIGIFSSSFGEIKHKFQVIHGNKITNFTGEALSFDLDRKIFCSCEGVTRKENGIGTWDLSTGKQVDFFYEPRGWPLIIATKLQWSEERNCLMVSTLLGEDTNFFIDLLDFRDKTKTVWSWSDIGTIFDRRILDAIVTKDGNSICVVDRHGDLSLIDLRGEQKSRTWCWRNKLWKPKEDEESHLKLGIHGDQLFLSENDSISVFHGPDLVPTSILPTSDEDPIFDFSIGGDRLFTLNNEKNVVQVWGTRPFLH